MKEGVMLFIKLADYNRAFGSQQMFSICTSHTMKFHLWLFRFYADNRNTHVLFSMDGNSNIIFLILGLLIWQPLYPHLTGKLSRETCSDIVRHYAQQSLHSTYLVILCIMVVHWPTDLYNLHGNNLYLYATHHIGAVCGMMTELFAIDDMVMKC